MASQIFQRNNFSNYYGTIDAHITTEIHRLLHRFGDNDHTQQRIAKLEDQGKCLVYLIEVLVERGMPSLEHLNTLIKATFAEESDAVVFSTIHRAKGQEARRVVILYPELMPASYARTSEAAQGEACVMFVALTRAKQDLVFVQQPPKETTRDFADDRDEWHMR